MKYKRILLKLSGEALSGETGHGINAEVLGTISDEVKELIEMGGSNRSELMPDSMK